MKKATESSLANLTQHMPPVTINFAAIAEQAEKDRGPADTRLHLRDLTGLEQQRGQLVYRIDGRKKDIAGQAPIVSELRRRATLALEELTALTEAEDVKSLRGEIKQKQKEADAIEVKWASESKLLERYENILTDAERTLKEWDRENGAKLKRLREMSRKIK